MPYTTADARQQLLDTLAQAADQLGTAVASLSEAYETLDESTAGMSIARWEGQDLVVETTGLAGGTGTYAFLVGVGSIQSDAVVVEQYFMRDFDEEPALLAALAPRLAEAAALVTFNGSGFDLPLLETRFVLARRRWPERIEARWTAEAATTGSI